MIWCTCWSFLRFEPFIRKSNKKGFLHLSFCILKVFTPSVIYLRLVLGLTKIDPKAVLNLGCIGCIYHYLVACLALGSVGLGIVLVLDLNVGLGLSLLLSFLIHMCLVRTTLLFLDSVLRLLLVFVLGFVLVLVLVIPTYQVSEPLLCLIHTCQRHRRHDDKATYKSSFRTKSSNF